MNEILILTLLNIPKIGRKSVEFIIKFCIDASLENNEILERISDARNLNKKIPIPAINDIEKAKEKAYEIAEKNRELGIKALTILDRDYPEKLKEIKDPPVILFYQGNVKCIFIDKSVAIIGTRKPSDYGKKIAFRLGEVFGEDEFVVVSGLATGCDENAHKGCLNVNGKTIAILPSPLDNIQPSSNKLLAKEILEKQGCIITEYPIGERIFKKNFVERDRIQSALSKGIIVVETSIESGTMHTVNFAKEQRKLIACFKHPEKYQNFESVKGNIELIRSKVVTKISNRDDIITFKKLLKIN